MAERRVIVIGAGAGGLAASIDLARQGVHVTLLEGAAAPGGKIHQRRPADKPIDCGPTVLTMRWVFDDLLHDCGQRLEEGMRLHRLPVIARHAWSADATLDLHDDPRRSIDAIAQFAGPAEARRFQSLCRQARALYRALEPAYIRSERPTLASMVRDLGPRGLMLLTRLGPFASLWQSLSRSFQDPRLRQLFARYATYCGGSPWLAPATLLLIADVEMQGVWAAEGGMQAMAMRLSRAATALGVDQRYDTTVVRIDTTGGRARGVQLADGNLLSADAVIFNGDAQALTQGLLGESVRQAIPTDARSPRSLSALTWAIQGDTDGFEPSYHNVFFHPDYRSEFDDIFARNRLPRQPTLYLCAQDRLPGQMTGAGRGERLFCLVNAPALGDQDVPDPEEIARCEQTAFRHLEHCGLRIRCSAAHRLRTTPQAFHQRFPGSGGALYGMAPHGWMSSFRRPTASTMVPGLFLCGGSTHPGAGVPMATLSGRLAAATLMAHLDSTRRSARVRISGGMSTASATAASTRSR